MHDYYKKEQDPILTPLSKIDFEKADRRLNGNFSRLANIERLARSRRSLIENILKSLHQNFQQRAGIPNTEITTAMGYGEYLLNWNIDLLSRVNAQQKITEGLRQTVRKHSLNRKKTLTFDYYLQSLGSA